MSSKTFGVVVGVIVSLAVAMFVGLYMLGLSGQGHTQTSARYYDYATDDSSYYIDEGLDDMPLE
jgi:ABC-type transporter Mla subunit MlaD